MCYERPGGQINRIQRHKKGLLLFRLGSVCLLLCTFFACAFGQVSGLSIGYFSSEHGLPHKHVYDITQDDYGYMWIATRNGLARYDGYTFEDYTYRITGRAQQKGIIVYVVEKDHQGNIWIGHSQGLTIMNTLTGQTTTKKPITAPDQDSSVYKIIFDRHGRPFLLLAKSVVHYDEKFNLVFQHEFISTQPTSNPEYTFIFQETDESFWISTLFLGADHLTRNGQFIEHFDFPASPAAIHRYKALFTPDGLTYNIPLGMRSDVQVPNHLKFAGPFDEDIKRAYIRPSVITDRRGNTWTIKNEGITIADSLSQPVQTFSLPYMEEYVEDHAWLSAYQGTDHTIWTTSRKGVFKIHYKETPFKNYLNREGLGVTEYGVSIRGMMEDEAGDVWIGSYAYTLKEREVLCNLHRLHPENDIIEPLIIGFKYGLSFNIVYTPMYKLVRQGKKFWASTGHYYLLHFDQENLEPAVIKLPEELTGTTTGIHAFNDSTILFSSVASSGFLTTTKGGEVRFDRLKKYGSDETLNGINDFFDAGHGYCWAAGNNGLYLIHPAGKVIRSYTQQVTPGPGLPALDINYVYPQSPEKIWLGSRHGLIVLDTISGKTRLYTMRDGLPNNNVMSVLPDEFGHLWLSTDNGLCRFHPEQNSFSNFDERDGLPQNEFNFMASLKASDGRLYFGGINGVTAFYPGDIDARLNTLQPLLAKYNYYDGRLDSVLNVEMPPGESPALMFSHFDRLFHFQFMLPSYRQADKNQFLYFLEGWDEEWQTTSGTNTIQYSYLTPGKYLLRVKGAAAGYSWGQLEYTLEIIIRQAWYKTWWSICLGVVMIGFLFYAVYRNRLNALMRVQQVRNKISADLHDELGSVLTQIALQSDMVSRDIYSESEKQKELENIRDTSRDAIHAMSDIVWSISAGHDKTSSLLDRMRDHADLMLQPLHIQPSFSVTGIDESKTIDNILRQELFLIFKEAVHNIVKHSHPGYVDIRLSNQSGEFEMRIRNDINKQSQQKVLGGHGLKNMQRRAATIQGTLSIRPSANEFEVVLKRKEI